jgi:hypothetical protein
MFGLEGQKKKKPTEAFTFDLEKDLENSQKHEEIKHKIEEKIQKIKEALRTGENQEEFDQHGILLHGYTSLLKVLSRVLIRKKS